MGKGKGRVFEACGNHAGTGEQEGVGHFPECEFGGKSGHRENRGARQDAGQGFGKFAVGHRRWRYGIDRAADGLVVQCEQEQRDQVVEGDPTHVLIARPDGAAQSQFEGQAHFGECPPVARQDDANARMHGSDTRFCGGTGGPFPSDRDLGEKALAGRAVFGEEFVPSVAVITDGRRGDERAWRRRQLREGLREQGRALHPAVPDTRLLRGCPTSRRDVLAGQMDDPIDIDEPRGVEDICSRIPSDFAVTASSAPRQGQNAIPARVQRGLHCRPNQARGTRY